MKMRAFRARKRCLSARLIARSRNKQRSPVRVEKYLQVGENQKMNQKKTLLVLVSAVLSAFLAAGYLLSAGRTIAAPVTSEGNMSTDMQSSERPVISRSEFDVQVLVDGRALEQYAARGRAYVQAIEGTEYELRVHNPFPFRVAVALSVDGLNTIDARHTGAWQASKWVIGPYQTIYVSGWQVSTERARHFYFTTERDSYGSKIGQTTNLGVIAAVFFSERHPIPLQVTPPPPRPLPVRPPYEDNGAGEARGSQAPAASARKEGITKSYPMPDDESAATGIGRSVTNDVRWVDMQLEPHPVSEVAIRYEYYQGLVRLGILPRPYPRPDSLQRREGARGFQDRRFSPEP